jgi:hypothetical protein
MACLAFATDIFWFRNTSGQSQRSSFFFVRLQNVLAQAKAGVKEGLIIHVGSIEILNQAG